MTEFIPVNLAVEDILGEAVVRKLLQSTGRAFTVGDCYSQGGFGYLKKTIRGFNAAAMGTPFLVLTDLDNAECPPVLVEEWLPVPRNVNLMFRVAVREVEAWLLAHRDGIAKFLKVPHVRVPQDPESLPDPKLALIQLAERSRSRDIRDDIVPPAGSARKVGPNYNGRLITFVTGSWDPSLAAQSADSLRRTLSTLAEFKPSWSSIRGSQTRRGRRTS